MKRSKRKEAWRKPRMQYVEVPDDISPVNPLSGEPEMEVKPDWRATPGVPLQQQVPPLVPITRDAIKYTIAFFLDDDRMGADIEAQDRLFNVILPAIRKPLEHANGKRYWKLDDADVTKIAAVAKNPQNKFQRPMVAAQFLPFHRTWEHPLKELPAILQPPPADESVEAVEQRVPIPEERTTINAVP